MVLDLVVVVKSTIVSGASDRYHCVCRQCIEFLQPHAGALHPLTIALKSQDKLRRESAIQVLHNLAQGNKSCQVQIKAMVASTQPDMEKFRTLFEQL